MTLSPEAASGSDPFALRLEKLREAMSRAGVDVTVVTAGADLVWLCGYEAMPLERMTALVVPSDREVATLVVPRLEAARVRLRTPAVEVAVWQEVDDPFDLVASLVHRPSTVAAGDEMWARFLLELMSRWSSATWIPASRLTGPLRARKEPAEIEWLRRAARAADEVVAALGSGEVRLVGRREADVAREIAERLVAAGHERASFVIVASGPNSASPHHEPGDRTIGRGEVVLCDFGGFVRDEHGVPWCSDVTRCLVTGTVPDEVLHVWRRLQMANAAAVGVAAKGVAACAVDRAARKVLEGEGLASHFVHRTGHGIGVAVHEHPYIVADNEEELEVGNVFSVEPGVYFEGEWGLRLEDIVAVRADGAEVLTGSPRHLMETES
ncbi:MAG: dipeptidase [Acidimicrobiales bacterium]|nr:MAG: dipeptidase [Acidimicrobiales bacterium]